MDDQIAVAMDSLPGVEWIWPIKQWRNDRIIAGPFTTRTLDKQDDKVFLESESRLKSIYDNANLIYEHHIDPHEPVIVLGDCLGVGFDKSGRTYGMWGVKDGTETIDEKWVEIKTYAEDAGFSIGGKVPDGSRKCHGGHCELQDPEILEVSWTKTPANTECEVYFINRFAKNLLQKSKEHRTEHGYHFDKAVQQIRKVFARRFEFDYPYNDYDIMALEKSHPCIHEYLYGAMELGVKRENAETMLDDLLGSIKKKVNKMKEQESIQKEEMAPPQPVQPEQSPNAAMEKLDFLIEQMKILSDRVDMISNQATGNDPEPQEEMGDNDEAPPAEAPDTEQEVEKADEEEVLEASDDEEEDDSEEKCKKSEEGEAPNPEIGPEPAVVDDITDKGPEVAESEAESPPLQELGEEPEDQGDKSDDQDNDPGADASDEVSVPEEIDVEPQSGEDEEKGIAKAYKLLKGKMFFSNPETPIMKQMQKRALSLTVDNKPGAGYKGEGKAEAVFDENNDPLKKTDKPEDKGESKLAKKLSGMFTVKK